MDSISQIDGTWRWLQNIYSGHLLCWTCARPTPVCSSAVLGIHCRMHIPQVPGRGFPRSRRVSSAVRKRSSMPRAIQIGSHEGHKHIQGLPWVNRVTICWETVTWVGWLHIGNVDLKFVQGKHRFWFNIYTSYYYVSWAFQRCVFGHCFSLWSVRYIYLIYIYNV